MYFSDCQSGAASACVPGNNANPGTSAAPKRDLSGINLNALAAGTSLLFARGGAWNLGPINLANPNATPAAPLTFDAFGSGSAPRLRKTSGDAFVIGSGTLNTGGYTFRNLAVDGAGTGQWGFFLATNARNVTIENVTISDFTIGVHARSGEPYGVTSVALRNSTIARSRDIGFLGFLRNSVIEGNLFEGNGGGSVQNHALYMSGIGSVNNTVRNNRFIRNSVVNGVCTGGNVTIHGQHDGLLIENNLIEQDAAAGSCLGVSVSPGYADRAEWFRNVVIRGNTTVNLGFCSVCGRSAPGVVIEGNRAINTQITNHHGVMWPMGVGDGADAADSNAVVRDNLVCQPTLLSLSSPVNVNVAGAVVSGNQLVTGSNATTGACAQ